MNQAMAEFRDINNPKQLDRQSWREPSKTAFRDHHEKNTANIPAEKACLGFMKTWVIDGPESVTAGGLHRKTAWRQRSCPKPTMI
jgi:hypothetical protein